MNNYKSNTVINQTCIIHKNLRKGLKPLNVNKFFHNPAINGWVTEKPAGRALARICELIRLKPQRHEKKYFNYRSSNYCVVTYAERTKCNNSIN